MQITDVRVLRMGAPSQNWNWLFVIVETDAGIRGIGEGSLQYKDHGLTAEIEDFTRWLIGQDPFQIDYIWNVLHRQVTWTGGAVTISAISAIDLALHDIKGKALGVPVYELLGGKVRPSVPVYANSWARGAQGPEEYAASASAVMAEGYKALKLYPFGRPEPFAQSSLNRSMELVAAVREAIGPENELMIDVRAFLDMAGAIRAAHALEPYFPAWMEEPIPFDNPETLAELSRSVRIPIATGEQLYTRWEFRALLESNAVRIIQPDICHAGGISELKKIATMAETYYVTVAPHNSNGPISTIASLHLDACIPNCFRQEIFVSFLPLMNEVLTEPIVIEDGYAALPQGPGWGTEIREDVIAAHPPHVYPPVWERPYATQMKPGK